MATWVQKKLEETYLNELDRILLQRLRKKNEESNPPADSRFTKPKTSAISKLSNEINEELDRLESMLEEDASKESESKNS